jgi:CheY-like chemotaxis protein
MLTAYDDPANKLIGKLQTRVYRYLTTPFVPDMLIQTVREAIASKQSRMA